MPGMVNEAKVCPVYRHYCYPGLGECGYKKHGEVVVAEIVEVVNDLK